MVCGDTCQGEDKTSAIVQTDDVTTWDEKLNQKTLKIFLSVIINLIFMAMCNGYRC